MDTLTKKAILRSYLIGFLVFSLLFFSERNVEAQFIKKVTVEPFSDPTNWEKSFKPGKFFSSMLENSLADSGIFQIVKLKEIEPNVVQKLRKQAENQEREEEKSNNDTQRNTASFGSLSNTSSSQYKVRGSILIFDPDTDPLEKGHTKKEARIHKEQAFIQANIELVNIRTGRSLANKTFKARSNTGRKSFDIDSQNIIYKLEDLKDRSIWKALLSINNQAQVFIYKALNKVPIEGDVISVDHKSNSAIINLGKTNGVNVRDVFTVFSIETKFNDPVNNDDLGDRYHRKGIIKISEVQGRFSKAQIVVGLNFNPGDLVVPKNRSPKNKLDTRKVIPWTKRYYHRDKKKNLLQADIIWGDFKGLSSLSY